jgi:D-alanyl-D-alanine carboxypeptidase (penicillin-binding protein 5/6)
MKTKLKILILCLSIIAISVITLLTQSSTVLPANAMLNQNNDTSEIVMEVNSNRVIHEKNAYDKRFMASTTKILTAIVIIENCDLNEKVIVTKDTTNIEGSSIYLEEGEELTVKELLYGLMLRSGNDCALTLAKHCSKNVEDFAILMNQTAQRIGVKNSNFVNPHGLHDDNHYTTAYDLALISCYAMKYNDFREIASTKSVKISHTKRDYDRYLKNKNKMLSEFDGATGIKTGYTKKAGRCLVSSAKKGGLEFVTVVLNCGPMFERSKELLNFAFNNYEEKFLVKSDNVIGYTKNENLDEDIPLYIKEDLILPLNKEEYESIKIVYDYPKSLSKPAKKDDEIGFIKIYSQNNLIFQQKIYIMVDEI